ncbi:MAG: reverse transcriptase domain-containing protein, partial [Candidatus Binatia bacterium]
FLLVDRARSLEPALPPEFFPDCHGEWIWTSTEDAQPPSGYAWNVSLGAGSSYRDRQVSHYRVRAVRAGECHPGSLFRSLHAAWREARRGKKPSQDQLRFDANWVENLLDLEERLLAKTWHPSPPICFVQLTPKAREIHAPAFADRVVHHWLVPILERLFEPTFIHDSYSNRVGKGTHAAVRRLRQFVRQVDSGQGGGYYLQLDVRNYFNSIHRATLYGILKRRMEHADLPEIVRRAAHALLNHSIERTGVVMACTEAEHAAVPAHKRLQNAAPGCGIAIGNLSSQFFANVYLDRLDQFVKHQLKVPRYIRYVDDFVLVHHDRAQLDAWRDLIVVFLRDELHLELKAEQRLGAKELVADAGRGEVVASKELFT